MSLLLPSSFKVEGERPQQTNPWLWLLELVVSRGDAVVPSVILRTTSGQTQINWPITAAGTGTGYLVNNGPGYGIGATSIAVDTGTGTILVGDQIQFAGHLTRYTVATALTAGVVVIAAPGLVASIANNEAVIVGPTETWYPFPFNFSPIEQNQEGDLPQLELSIDNTARFLSEHMHAGNGMEGNPATLFLVPTAALPLVYPNHQYQRWDLQVAGAVMGDEAIAIRLEMPNFFTSTSPTDCYVPSRCRWQYGGGQCGYVLNAFAAFATCPKTIQACIDRGADLVARGLPAVLPANYGGHPGVSVQRR
jgi:hypothetical protein